MSKTEHQEDTSASNRRYAVLLIATLLQNLLIPFGILGIVLFAIMVAGPAIAKSTDVNPDSTMAEVAESTEQLNEPIPPIVIGAVEGRDAEESALAIMDLYEKNNAYALNYWGFRSNITKNTTDFVEAVGDNVTIRSNTSEGLGTDTGVEIVDETQICYIKLGDPIKFDGCE